MENNAIKTKTVTDLTEKTTPADTDLFMAGNAGTATLKKLKWSSMLAAIKTKIAEWTFQTLNTSDKTIPGALNELNNKTFTSPEYNVDAGVTVIAKNGIVFLYGSSTTRELTANTWNVIGTLSPALSPSREIQFVPSNMGRWVDMIGSVLTDGKVRVFPKSNTSHWNFVISYPYKG